MKLPIQLFLLTCRETYFVAVAVIAVVKFWVDCLSGKRFCMGVRGCFILWLVSLCCIAAMTWTESSVQRRDGSAGHNKHMRHGTCLAEAQKLETETTLHVVSTPRAFTAMDTLVHAWAKEHSRSPNMCKCLPCPLLVCCARQLATVLGEQARARGES